MSKAFLEKAIELFGVARSVLAILSVGIAHNFAFMMPMPREFWPLVDATFLSGITVQYLFFLSGVLVLTVFTSQVLGVARGAYLAFWVRRLERRHRQRLFPSAKRERYFDRVRRTVEGRIAPTALVISWGLPVAVIGYFYAGLLALISLPALIALFSISVPILYPNLNPDIRFVDGEDEQIRNQNAHFWTAFFSDVSTLRQLAAFVMSATILLSGYLGITRHSYLAKAAQFEFLQSGVTERLSLIGANAQGYVTFNVATNEYLLVSYSGVSVLRSAP